MEKKAGKQSSNHVIWDCESSLYDSFELKALEKQLYAAISSRSLSMPHLSGRRDFPPPPPPPPASKISRFFRKLTCMGSIFRPKRSKKGEKNSGGCEFGSKEGFYVVYESLSRIPEVAEFNGPEIRSSSASERFTAL